MNVDKRNCHALRGSAFCCKISYDKKVKLKQLLTDRFNLRKCIYADSTGCKTF